MPRTALLHRLSARTRALGAVVLLAVVVTAGAPSFVRVRSGDSLSEIAQRHGTSVAELRRLNRISGSTIYAGALLKVPGSSGSTGGTRTVERGYTVRAGDTLSHIAQRYGVTVDSIRRRNRLTGPLQIGRRLAVPVRVGASGSTSRGGSGSAPTYNAGVRVPDAVSASAAANRALLRRTPQPSKAQVRAMVARTARRHGVSPTLALAVAYHESGFQQHVVSGVNAIGAMQVLPSTARVLSQQHGLRLNILKAQDNVTAGVLLLRQLQRSVGSERMVLAGYYQGLGSISRKGLLPQTHDYIRSIGILKARFRNG